MLGGDFGLWRRDLIGDLEEVAEGIADHGTPVAVWGIQRFLNGDGPSGERSLVARVGVIDVYVQER